ncbi:Stp1/IreP family PP2C-type Ser/Thr phosphatase [Bacillus sp. PS06]|uniref:Stp1/IreP family PP2C-type Ser/Thr phosphatase n=1 Tax=Bacillus sp. PS06 TaxID=2764176 RepID=UPI001784429B|nr:Stp1/IreP family PP2C-type Ser/Thr phosphatase [Bacillus sp. PS06]MBD8068346.1 Stp1/IreP family PP2C-type Ser/Thr phosphatase [Bacillus sp. PS06]
MKSVCLSDRGRVRQLNEDSCGVFTNTDGLTLAVVADGMGGHRAGDVASSMATSLLKELWEQSKSIDSPELAENWLREHIEQINQKLYKHSQDNSECQGMGTTVDAVICSPTFATIAHIGDSRCYLSNSNGFNLMTSDHTLVNELVKSGQISKEDAEHHPRKNWILRALGTEPSVEMDIKTIILEEGDFLLLCSDGLTNKVQESELNEVLHTNEELQKKAEVLVQMANENGGEDNITLVIVQYSSMSESG